MHCECLFVFYLIVLKCNGVVFHEFVVLSLVGLKCYKIMYHSGLKIEKKFSMAKLYT